MFLNTHSYYSLRYGTIAPKELISLMKSINVEVFSFTDINATTMALDVFRMAKMADIKVVLGVDFRNKAQQKFIMLAKNNLSFKNINNYLSAFLHQHNFTILNKAKQIKNTIVIYPFYAYDDINLNTNEYLGVRIQDIGKLRLSKWIYQQEKLVVLQTVSFQNKKGFNINRLLRAIDNNTLLIKISKDEKG